MKQTATSLQSQITANDTDISTMSQTVKEVNIEVGKKYNTSDFTNAKITAKLNDGTSSVKISADKINLSAVDILNLLAGNEINISSHNISIKGDVLEIDKYGNITLNSKDGTPALTIRDYSGDEIEMYPSNFNMIWNYFGNTMGAYLQKGGLYIESSNGSYINLNADEGYIEISTNGKIKRITGNG